VRHSHSELRYKPKESSLMQTTLSNYFAVGRLVKLLVLKDY